MTEHPIAFVVIVTDGATLRTLHPAGLGSARAASIERVIREHLYAGGSPLPATLISAASNEAVKINATATQREIAQGQGFTGDACGTCHSFAMKRAGTCLTCQACGSTTGCS